MFARDTALKITIKYSNPILSHFQERQKGVQVTVLSYISMRFNLYISKFRCWK